MTIPQVLFKIRLYLTQYIIILLFLLNNFIYLVLIYKEIYFLCMWESEIMSQSACFTLKKQQAFKL